MVLCKIALARNNQQMMDANWAHIKEERPRKATAIFNKPKPSDISGVISSMDTREKKEFTLQTVSGSNLSLAGLVEWVEWAVKDVNLTLEELPKNVLQSLAKSRAFKERAKQILDAEAQKEETLSP